MIAYFISVLHSFSKLSVSYSVCAVIIGLFNSLSIKRIACKKEKLEKLFSNKKTILKSMIIVFLILYLWMYLIVLTKFNRDMLLLTIILTWRIFIPINIIITIANVRFFKDIDLKVIQKIALFISLTVPLFDLLVLTYINKITMSENME